MPEFAIDTGARVAASGANTLPYSRADLNQTKQVLLHFKVADASPQMRLEVSQAVTAALRGVRVNGHALVPMITDESVNMTAVDIQIIAAHIAPTVARALGITLPT